MFLKAVIVPHNPQHPHVQSWGSAPLASCRLLSMKDDSEDTSVYSVHISLCFLVLLLGRLSDGLVPHTPDPLWAEQSRSDPAVWMMDQSLRLTDWGGQRLGGQHMLNRGSRALALVSCSPTGWNTCWTISCIHRTHGGEHTACFISSL